MTLQCNMNPQTQHVYCEPLCLNNSFYQAMFEILCHISCGVTEFNQRVVFVIALDESMQKKKKKKLVASELLLDIQ